MQCETLPLCPAADFPAVALSADDFLPADILLLLVYRHLPENINDALAAGLRAFPHLTGRIDVWPPRIIPASDGTPHIERAMSAESLKPTDFRCLGLGELLTRFAPAERDNCLFAARRVDFPRTGVSALCLRVSHMAVDGHGLGLFLAHTTASARGVAPPPVTHDRSSVLNPDEQPCEKIPDAHVERPLAQAPGLVNPDVLAASDPLWFAVPTEIAGGRNSFAAWLCVEAARIHPVFRRLAIWCNTRGRGGAPPAYTGNAGCYLHLDIPEDDAPLASGIRTLASRGGLARARHVHQQIVRLRSVGREVWWNGPHDDVLQLNLLSPPVAVADFGTGPPACAHLLSRNSSGLRIFPDVCGTQTIVEATLPPGVGAALFEACARRGLSPEKWGGGFA